MELVTKRCTLADVARLAGVSPTTASMALSDSPRVSSAAKDAVLLAASKLGYVPHAAGRALRSHRVHALAVVFPHSSQHVFSHPTLTSLLDGIVSLATDNELSTIISTSRTEDDEASAYKRFMHGREADGVIVAAAAVADPNIVELARSGYPTVMVGRSPHLREAVTVGLDDLSGAEAVTMHLLAVHGVRRVAHISGPLRHQSAQDKISGYRRALMAAAIAPDTALEFEGDYSDQSGTYAVQHLLKAGTHFEAIFAANDQMALGARQALSVAGLRVPHDVLLVGYDNIPMAKYVEPSLTTVDGDMVAVGALAAKRLLTLIGDEHPETSTLLPTTLTIRRSCGCQ